MKIWKKVLGWMLCVMMVAGMLPTMEKKAQAEPVEETTAVDDDEIGIRWNQVKNYYEISNYMGLYEFAKIVNGESDIFENNDAADAILVADIIVTDEENREYPWKPIGNYKRSFYGVFDGKGHTISNLFVDLQDESAVGLFGHVVGSIRAGEVVLGIIQNVGLENSRIIGHDCVGGIVGDLRRGAVINCHNTGDVSGIYSVGGIVGFGYNGDHGYYEGSQGITYCYNTGNVSGESDQIGGVAGYNEFTVTNCYNTGNVSGERQIGGVAGCNEFTVTNCYNTGNVSGNDNIGGVAGRNTFTVTNCYNTGDLTGRSCVGGVIGINEGDLKPAVVKNCYSNGHGKNYGACGVVGENYGTVTNCYFDKSVFSSFLDGSLDSAVDYYNNIVIGLTTDQMTGENALTNMVFSYEEGETSPWLVKANDGFYSYYPRLTGFDFDATGNQLSAENISDWTPRKVREDVIKISNYEELVAFAKVVNEYENVTANALLTADIIVTDEDNRNNPWIPIGTDEDHAYEGIFDGDGHVIANLIIDRKEQDHVGLFGYVKGIMNYEGGFDAGIIRNVGMEKGEVIGKNYVGGIVGGCDRYNCAVINCYNTTTVLGQGNYVGGVVGNGSATYCYNTAAVLGQGNYVGGVVARGRATYCYNTAAVHGQGNNVGGVVGDGSATYCYNTAAVHGQGNNVGGVVGNGRATYCYNTDAVHGQGNNVGGVVGSGRATYCFNTGYVHGEIKWVGGIVGFCNGIVTNCYNTGEVHGGEDKVGGVIGENNGTVTNCYNTGVVTGKGCVGGVVGDNRGTVKNCYYDKSIWPIGAVNYSDDDSNSVLGLTTAQMTGENALSNMVFFNDENSISPWITAEDIVTDEKTYWRSPYSLQERVSDRKTYWCYPHLRGFDYDTDKSNANWPAKIEVSVIWITANSFTYNGTTQGLKVEKVIVGDVSAPDESIVSYYVREHEPIPGDWDEGYSAIRTSRPGTYMMAIAFDDSEETVTKYFSILDKDLYTVTYDDGSTEGCINAGAHTAVVTFEVYKDETGEEKKRSVTESFTIKPAELTLTAKSGTETYDGTEKTVSGFACRSKRGNIDGLSFSGVSAGRTETDAGKYDVTFTGVTLNTTKDTTGNYVVTETVNGTLKIEKAGEFTISLEDASYEYDGTPKAITSSPTTTAAGGDTTFEYSKEKDGTYVTDLSSLTATKVSESCTIYVRATNPNYEKTATCTAKLTITAKEVTITADSDTKEYDGTSLTVGSYGYTTLAGGDRVESVTIRGSQTEAGSSKNEISNAKIVNGSNEDVTDCYAITYVDGTLRIGKAEEFTVSLEGASYEYDGTPKAITSSPTTTAAGGDTTFEYSKEKDGTYVTDLSSLTATKVLESCTIYVRATNSNYKNTAVCTAELTITRASAPEMSALSDGEKPAAATELVENGEKPAAATELVENGEKQLLLTEPETLPEGYTAIEYSSDDGKTWTTKIPEESEAGTYTIKTRYTADDNHTDFEGETYEVTIKALYTVIWKDGDGSTLDTKTYVEGETEPTTDKTPTKDADEDYTYVFQAWKQPGTVEGKTTTYKPEFLEIDKEVYTVVWLNGDDSVLESKTYKEDETEPTTDKIPTMAEDADYTYQFTGWDNGTVKDNTKTYRGIYEATEKTEYTVIWLNGDGTELDRKTYKEGAEEPTTDKIPTKEADEDYTYAFQAWKQPGTVEGTTTTYEPEFLQIAKAVYTVVWLNGDGTVLDSKTFKEDETEPTTDKIPTMAEDADYTYQFTGWDNGTVKDNTKTYRGIYEATEKTEYTVIWLNGDGTELDSKTYKEGAEEPTTDKIPTKDADEDYTYVFQEWKQPGIVEGTTTTYEPEFLQIAKDVFAVVWLNGDGTVLDSKTFKEDETEPTTDKIPTMAEDADYTYQFTGWDNGTVKDNTKTYRGIYEATEKTEYTVIWLNGDGTELDRKTYKEGAEEPTTDKIPTKDADEDYTYVFREWKQLGIVEGTTTTYEPEFLQIAKPEYIVVWLNGDGTVLDSKTYKEGEAEPKTDRTPTRSDTEEFFYEFLGWSDGTVSGTITTYESMFLEVPKEMYKLLNAVYEWKQGSDGTIVITVKRAQDDANCITYFTAVRIGNVLVPAQDYTAVAGSTVITLKSEYLNTLNPGEYDVEIEFVDGKVTAVLRVIESEKTVTPTPTPTATVTPTPTVTVMPTPTPEPSPTPVPSEPSAKTGDTSNLWLWAILTIIASGVLGGVVAGKRARKAM